MFDDDDLHLFVDSPEEEEEDSLDIEESLESSPKVQELSEHDQFLLYQTQQFKRDNIAVGKSSQQWL
jgi:hypothetical protein